MVLTAHPCATGTVFATGIRDGPRGRRVAHRSFAGWALVASARQGGELAPYGRSNSAALPPRLRSSHPAKFAQGHTPPPRPVPVAHARRLSEKKTPVGGRLEWMVEMKGLPRCLRQRSWASSLRSSARDRPLACRDLAVRAHATLSDKKDAREWASGMDGGDEGARTLGLRLAKPALSQLSYIPVWASS